jgi:hypothetical protein
MKVIEEKAFQYLFYFLISIDENIFHKHEKILDIDFHLMLLEHDQLHKPIKYIFFVLFLDEKKQTRTYSWRQGRTGGSSCWRKWITIIWKTIG